jgi:predicted phosphodiesterase
MWLRYGRAMRVAVLSDIHGNLPALEAVLAEVEREAPDVVVIGGDNAAGPMPRQTLDRLAQLGDTARYVMGNADRELVEAFAAAGAPDAGEDPAGRVAAWCATQLDQAHIDALAAYEPTVTLDVDGLGPTLFCHGTPRSDTEIITILTGPDRLAPMVADVAERTIVCGHTHRTFDHVVGGRRIVNAGSVGMPYEGDAAAFWALLGPDVQLRRTAYDVAAAARTMRAAGLPDVDELVLRESLLEPADPDEVARYFEGLGDYRP